MPQRYNITTGSLSSVSASWGEAQLVALPGRIVIDLQTTNFDTAGHRRRDYAVADLPLNSAIELRDRLNEAILASANATQHHPGTWGDHTGRAVVRKSSRRAA